jgi:hypothetical protein
LREARMLHYGATSRSARIVVTPLHESPGPATAGASLFWTPDSRPVRAEDGPSANLAKQGVRYYRQRYRQPDARHRPVALRPMSKARVTARRPPKRCSASHRRVFWARFARGEIAKASSDFAKRDKARSGMGERTLSSTPMHILGSQPWTKTASSVKCRRSARQAGTSRQT